MEQTLPNQGDLGKTRDGCSAHVTQKHLAKSLWSPAVLATLRWLNFAGCGTGVYRGGAFTDQFNVCQSLLTTPMVMFYMEWMLYNIDYVDFLASFWTFQQLPLHCFKSCLAQCVATSTCLQCIGCPALCSTHTLFTTP